MKYVAGKKKTIMVEKVIETDAKYIADDGTEFDNEFDCKQHEARILKERNWARATEWEGKLHEHEITLNTDGSHRIYVYKFESEKELEDCMDALIHLRYVDAYCYSEFNKKKVQYPATFVIKDYYKEYEDTRDSQDFTFFLYDEFVNLLKSDIKTLEDAAK